MNIFISYVHRDVSAYTSENTMSVFKKTFDIGANGVELDLRKTKDDRIDKKSNERYIRN